MILLIGLFAVAHADTTATTPDIASLKLNGFAMYNFETKSMQTAPGLTYPILSVLNGAVILNAGAVLPVTDTGGSTGLKVGPIASVVVNKLVANVTGVQWLAPQGVEVGAGVLFDLVGITKTGSSFKNSTYPAVYLKIYTF